jgi:hypothetical protein
MKSAPVALYEPRGILCTTKPYRAQSRQSAKLFLRSSEFGLPHPITRRRVCTVYPPGWGGGAYSFAGEGVGESQFGRGDKHCGTLGM